ncbi:hypothetical protein CPter91_0270 [Collimonas pratensis]|uniref:Uncharacterized protein n=1 Tax=Collimonas pratensis TaxID=279113 RepID=A0A127PY19_9BURK|nr:hypothetical protein CPter91_0270 [Collimonas pratensis]
MRTEKRGILASYAGHSRRTSRPCSSSQAVSATMMDGPGFLVGAI